MKVHILKPGWTTPRFVSGGICPKCYLKGVMTASFLSWGWGGVGRTLSFCAAKVAEPALSFAPPAAALPVGAENRLPPLPPSGGGGWGGEDSPASCRSSLSLAAGSGTASPSLGAAEAFRLGRPSR